MSIVDEMVIKIKADLEKLAPVTVIAAAQTPETKQPPSATP